IHYFMLHLDYSIIQFGIRQIVAEILSDIDKNQLNLTYRRYDTFFDRIGMTYRRKFDILAKFDRQFKNHNVTLWAGKEPVKKMVDFPKGETITFRSENIEVTKKTTTVKALIKPHKTETIKDDLYQ